jgi:hypothetical protein
LLCAARLPYQRGPRRSRLARIGEFRSTIVDASPGLQVLVRWSDEITRSPGAGVIEHLVNMNHMTVVAGICGTAAEEN